MQIVIWGLKEGDKLKKYEKEVMQAQLDNEKEVLKKLEKNYEDALEDINNRIAILLGRKDADRQYVVYQVEFQQSLKKQVEMILERLHSNEFETVSEYLMKSYEEGFFGTMYSLQKQGIPLVLPLNQEQIVNAIQNETKLSENLYTTMGQDIKDLQEKIAGEISRGISSGQMYSEIARNIALCARIPLNNAMRITRTEAHRLQCRAGMDACERAKSKGADVVKQWDATLDGRTRKSHRRIDGEIRELNEKFSNGLMYPGDPEGSAEEVINCRCALLQRARWALDNDDTELSMNQSAVADNDDVTQFTVIKAKNFEDFKQQYNQTIEQSGKLKLVFPDDVYKVKGFTEEVKKEVDTALKKLNNEYDIRLHSIVVEPAAEGDIFITGYHRQMVDMVINENSDFHRIIKNINRRYSDGFYAGKSLEDYLAHEMAHCMLYQDCASDATYYAKYRQIESLYDKLQGISGYADSKKSGNEALAEAFVRVKNNEEVPPIVKTLVNAYFGKWKK